MAEKKVRKQSEALTNILEEIKKKNQENPIVEELEDTPILGLTKTEHIKELQHLLVQTCIDYINKNGLKDIYAVYFNADCLAQSAEFGEWQPCTDSYIRVDGSRANRRKRKNGEIVEIPYWYTIGEYH